mmetsp:Transcript_81535/g.264160  ORF Transcript_81535/g.264160 Transcript_81535/m.264160 type:complete len:200 (+) Transcript_81535:1025-1624(+)
MPLAAPPGPWGSGPGGGGARGRLQGHARLAAGARAAELTRPSSLDAGEAPATGRAARRDPLPARGGRCGRARGLRAAPGRPVGKLQGLAAPAPRLGRAPEGQRCGGGSSLPPTARGQPGGARPHGWRWPGRARPASRGACAVAATRARGLARGSAAAALLCSAPGLGRVLAARRLGDAACGAPGSGGPLSPGCWRAGQV